ncbi:MAG: hypothetical protein JSW51_06465 [Gemmatimonadota bacterium]|nr:MAG: hypothetical protein JSW51_06465 [Gemmatimonadota bacterium]
MLLIIAAVFAILFYRAAYNEHMNGWAWAVASFALSLVVTQLLPGFTALVVAQIGLFGVLWWVNTKRLSMQGERWIRAREEERRLRKERVDRAREQARRTSERHED